MGALPDQPAAASTPAGPPEPAETGAPAATPTATAAPAPALAAPPASRRPGPAPLPAYTFDVSLDYDGHALEATQWLTVTNDSDQQWLELVFNVSPAYWPGRFELLAASRADSTAREPLAISWDSTMLHVPLTPGLVPGEATTVVFSFRLNLPELDPAGWGPDGNAGWAANVTQVGDWYPALIPYDAANGGWQVWRYHPVGDPVRSTLADHELLVRAGPGVAVVAPGYQGAAGNQYHFLLKKARAAAFLASRDYVLLESQTPLPVHVHVLAEHAASAPVVLDTALQAIDLFTERYGPYPYEELVIAENGFLTAMEYPALISLSHFAFTSYQGSPDSLLIAITAHEVAHQWFYGAVGSDQVEAPWLDEALAMLSEWLYYEAVYPELVDWWWHFRVDRWQPAGPIDVSIYAYGDSPTFVHNLYGRAAHFMRELRLLLGDEAFAAFLRTYYEQNRHLWATSDSFFAATLPYTSPEALQALTARYFQTTPTVLTAAPH